MEKNCTCQKDWATSHTHRLSQVWLQKPFPRVINKHIWPLNNLNVNELNYSVWGEFAQQLISGKVSYKNNAYFRIKMS